MEKGLQYLLSANILLAVIALYYRAFLARQMRFHWNRAFLLGGMGLALVLPLLRFSLAGSSLPNIAVVRTLPEVLIGSNGNVAAANSYSWPQLLFYVYGVIALGLTGLFLLRLGRLLIRIVRAPRESKFGHTLVHAPELGPASFFGFLFWDKSLEQDPQSAAAILAHEQCHIRQKHSIDMLLVELLCIFAWFNPLVYLLRRDLRRTHEFLADQAAAKVAGKQALRRLVIARHIGLQHISLVNSFYSHINARIIMLKQKSSSKTLLRYLLILPMFAFMAACTSTDTEADKAASSDNTEVKTDALGDADHGHDHGDDHSHDGHDHGDAHSHDGNHENVDGKAVDFDPENPGPNDFVAVDTEPVPLNMKELSKKIGYPEKAKNDGIEGKVIVRVKVGKTGEYLEHQVLKDPDATLTSAVTDQISKLKFTPAVKDGKSVVTWVTIPFKFDLMN